MFFLNELQSKVKKTKSKGTKPNECIDQIEEWSDFCSITEVFNALQESPFQRKYLLLDIRPKNEFQAKKMNNSINLYLSDFINSKSIKNISEIDSNKSHSLQFISGFKIIAFGTSENDSHLQSLLQLQKQLYSDTNEDNILYFRIMKEGFESFADKYPFQILYKPENENENKTETNMNSNARIIRLPKYPNEILNNQLYLGTGAQAINREIIDNLCITHIANITEEVECKFEGSDDRNIKYIQVKITDEVDTNIASYFVSAIQFIEDALVDDNHRVLVHCQFGISRSSSIVIAFLMKRNGWTFEESMKYVKKRRTCVSPNEAFIEQLKRFQL